MPIQNTILAQMLDDLAHQQDGFSFGEPKRYSDKALGLVVPILRKGNYRRNYIMSREGKINLKDSGKINKVHVTNNEDTPAFIRGGTIFGGDTQERAVIMGIVIDANTTSDVPVRCVHASKGIRGGSIMRDEGIVPHEMFPTFIGGKQEEVWNHVRRFTTGEKINRTRDEFSNRFSDWQSRSLSLHSKSSSRDRLIGARVNEPASAFLGGVSTYPIETDRSHAQSDDLLGNLKEISKGKVDMENFIKQMKPLKDQVGAVVFDGVGIVGVELFDTSKSWKVLHEQVLKKYDDALTLEQEEPIFTLQEDMVVKKITEFVEKVLGCDEKELSSVQLKSNNSYAHTTELINGGIIGEYTQIGSHVIHIFLMKRHLSPEEKKKQKGKELEVTC